MIIAVVARPKADGAEGAELPRYFYRLSARAQRTYLKSDAIDSFELLPDPTACALAAALNAALEAGAPLIIARATQAVADHICGLAAVSNVRVEVRGVRPHNGGGELHGIFYPRGSSPGAAAPLIVLWMRTARRHEPVKPKTFARTLMHELGHYLDYSLLRLDDSFHTGGFFKRESFLVRMLRSAEPAAGGI